MSAEAIVKQEQFIVLTGNETTADVGQLVAKLELPGTVAISFRQVGDVDLGFLGDLMGNLSAAGAESVRAVEATPHEVKFLKVVAFSIAMPFAA